MIICLSVWNQDQMQIKAHQFQPPFMQRRKKPGTKCNIWVLYKALLHTQRTQKIMEKEIINTTVKRLSTMWETRVRSLGREDPLEKEMAIHSSTIAWKIPWTEKPGSLQSVGLQRVRHNWATTHTNLGAHMSTGSGNGLKNRQNIFLKGDPLQGL